MEERIHFSNLKIGIIIGNDRTEAIITVNDRATGMLKMKKTQGKDAEILAENVVIMLKDWKRYLFTITGEKGKEFAHHKVIAKSFGI